VITFYCINCWATVPESATICPHCGDDIAVRQARADFVDKLIAALHLPEPTTVMRAAWVLGRRRERRAVAALRQLAAGADDGFIAASAVEALEKIGAPEVLGALRRAARHSSPRVRRVAARAMRTIESSEQSETAAPTTGEPNS